LISTFDTKSKLTISEDEKLYDVEVSIETKAIEISCRLNFEECTVRVEDKELGYGAAIKGTPGDWMAAFTGAVWTLTPKVYRIDRDG
jgi:hypothetical protein